MSVDIPINEGVKQGSVLAPMLFKLFISDLASHLPKIDAHSLKINQFLITVLL